MIKTILIYVVSLIAFIAVLNFTVFNITPPNNTFLKGLELKHKRALRIQSPKIIINGGSNLAFGINSPLIEKELNLPVCNLGIMAGLGFEYMIEQAKFYAKDGDVVILVPEYFLYSTPESDPKGGVLLSAASIFPFGIQFMKEDLPFLNFQYKSQSALKRLLLAKTDGEENSTGVYNASAFNEYGDIYIHDDTLFDRNIFDNYTTPLEKDVISDADYDDFENLLKETKEYFDIRNIKLYVSFPPTPNTDKRKDLDGLAMGIFGKCGIALLGTPNDFRYGYDDFYNGLNHLNFKGAIKRSKLLSEFLILEKE
jgi:hypothetical protein